MLPVPRPDGVSGHVFHSFWLQTELSPLEQLAVASFLAHGHRFVLYSYDAITNAPSGCELEDARSILPRDSVFFYRSGLEAGHVSAFTNLFRYELLHRRGGWWVDTDVVCLADAIPETEYVFAKQDDEEYGSAILKAPGASGLAGAAVERTQALGSEVGWGDTGPALVTALVEELGLAPEAWRREQLYPIPWLEAFSVFDPAAKEQLTSLLSGSCFVHLWTSIFRIYNVLKTVRPPAGSLLSDLYERHAIPFPPEPRYNWADLTPLVALLEQNEALWKEIVQLRGERAARAAAPGRSWPRALLGRFGRQAGT